MTGAERRAVERAVLSVWLVEEERTVEVADGEIVGLGYAPYLDRGCTRRIEEDNDAPVLPGVFCARLSGVSFHDDVAQLPHFAAGRPVEIRTEPANARDLNPLAVYGGGLRVGYVPAPIAGSLAPSGTRVGRGIVLTEWSSNGQRHGLTVLGSMHVTLQLSVDS